MINAEELLKAIAESQPCGPDISEEPAFLELDTLIKGKPETEFGPGEPPNWKKVRDRCLELLKRSKHMRLAVSLAVAELELEGIPAFRQCLALLNGMITTYWKEYYPRLVEADGNDPTERVNIIGSLAAKIGTYGDPMRVAERLRNWPLTNSRIGKFSAADIFRSRTGKQGPDGKPAVSESQILAAFSDTKREELDKLEKSLLESIDLVGALEDGLTKAVGADKAVSLEELRRELKEIYALLPGAAPAKAEEAGRTAEGGAGPQARPISGDIGSRRDVVAMLDKICLYYDRHEPSSPVPFLLKRAKRLAEKNFMEIINDLHSDALAPIQKITGEEPKPGTPPSS